MYKIKKISPSKFKALREQVKEKISIKGHTIHKGTKVYYCDIDRNNFKFNF